MPEFELIEVSAPEDMAAVRELFEEYAAWLGFDLCFQGFEEELATLPGKYSRPKGFIYLAKVDGAWAGSIAVRPLGDGGCEMKRLYVRPAFRGGGIASALVKLSLEESKKAGYKVMKLDTLERMASAIRLYEAFGFERTGEYCANPMDDVVYLEKML